ncbi:MAG: CDP-alcohol phosphatidyltransferase family protein [Allosphingosinicella sp.]
MGCEKTAEFVLEAEGVQAIVRFRSGRDAGRLIAGVTAAARILREIEAAGARRVWLVADDDETLSSDVARDCARLVPGLEVRQVPQARLAASHAGASGIAIFSGDHLIPAASLRPLLGRDSATLVHHGATIATRLQAGARFDSASLGGKATHDEEATDILALVPHARATATILKGTGKDSDGLVSRWINRPISRRITALLINVGWLRPIHMTWCTAAIGLLMAASLFFGGENGLVIGAWLLQAASVIDGVDGEMARATYRSSEQGATLDTVVDMITNLAFVLGMTVSLTMYRGPHYAAIGGLALAELVLGLAVIYLLNRRRGGPVNFDLLKLYYVERYDTSFPYRITRFITIATSRDFLVMLVLVMIALGGATWIPYVGAVTATIWLFWVLIAVPLLWPGRSGAAADQGA